MLLFYTLSMWCWTPAWPWSRRRWWNVLVSGPNAHYWSCRVYERDWYKAGRTACRVAAEHHGFRPEQYHVNGVEPERS